MNSKTIATITNVLITNFDEVFGSGQIRNRLMMEHNNKKKSFQKKVTKDLAIDMHNQFTFDQFRSITSNRNTWSTSHIRLANNFKDEKKNKSDVVQIEEGQKKN